MYRMSAAARQEYKKKLKLPPFAHQNMMLFSFLGVIPGAQLLAYFDVFSRLPVQNYHFWLLPKLEDFAKYATGQQIAVANGYLWISILFPLAVFFGMLCFSFYVFWRERQEINFKSTTGTKSYLKKLSIVILIFACLFIGTSTTSMEMCRYCGSIDYSTQMSAVEYAKWQMKPTLFLFSSACAFTYLAMFVDFNFTDKHPQT